MGRIKWIDVAKGICILSVIAGHFNFDPINKVVYLYHLIVFVMLSGYTLKKRKVNREFINKKFKVILMPYLITCVAITIMDCINSILINKDASILTITNLIGNDFIRSYFASGSETTFSYINLGTRIGAIWFLPALFIAVLIVSMILEKINNKFKEFIFSIFLALIAIISARFIWLPFSIQSAFLFVPFLLFGYYIREDNLLEKIKTKQIILFLCISIVTIISSNSYIYLVICYMPDYFLSTVGGISASILIFKLSEFLENNKALLWIGKNSLKYLCVHLFILETIRGQWLSKIFNLIEINNEYFSFLLRYIIEVLLITVIVMLINYINTKVHNFNFTNKVEHNYNTNYSLDIMKGILIILVIFGHFNIDQNLRSIIYSIHLVSFMVIDGYNYKSSQKFSLHLKKSTIELLLPYLLFSIIAILINQINVLDIIFAMSFSKNLFPFLKSVGPIYFLPLMFCVRLLFSICDCYIKNNEGKIIYLVSMLYMGIFCGHKGIWLPWSFDVGMVCLIFFAIGRLLCQFNILQRLNNYLSLYFVFSTLWAFMIFSGSIEIAIRNYSIILLTIVGAISGISLLCLACKYILSTEYIPLFVKEILIFIGNNYIYILVVHSLLGNIINNKLEYIFDSRYIYLMIISIFFQLILGLLLSTLLSVFKKLIPKSRNKIKVNFL